MEMCFYWDGKMFIVEKSRLPKNMYYDPIFIFITEVKHAHYKHIRKHKIKYLLTTNCATQNVNILVYNFFP